MTMSLTQRELWTVLHGMLFGAVYLLAFAGGFAGLWNMTLEACTPAGLKERVRRLMIGTSVMAAVCWLTVISGTYIVYPWYRAKGPDSAKSHLLANPATAEWHNFGMEWKEHVTWIAPFLATAVVLIVLRYREELAVRKDIRRAALIMFALAFFAAAAGGVFGAFINKAAPVL
jgi:hypothetical protein